MRKGILLYPVLFGLLAYSPLLSAYDAGAQVEGGKIEERAAEKNGDDFVDLTGEDFDDVPEGEDTVVIPDPFEPVNRGVFWFNDKLYFYLLKPVARGLRAVPEPARISASNFFSNLATPLRFANALLQLKFKDAGNELARFIINSTVGIGGLFDPAKRWAAVKKKEEDFGQTLGRYGMKPGIYIVLPLLGPSNSRDVLGEIADYFLDPWRYAVEVKDLESIGLATFEAVNELSLDKDTYESIKRQALDPYVFIRNAQTQRREGLVKE